MEKYFKALKQLGIFTTGVVTHHYTGKLLDRQTDLQDAAAQEERDNKIASLSNKLDTVNLKISGLKSDIGGLFERVEEINKRSKTDHLTPETTTQIKSELSKGIKAENNLEHVVSYSDYNETNVQKVIDHADTARTSLEKVKSILEEVSKNKFLSELKVKTLTDFLDKLTLLEESSLLHIIMFLTIISISLNILAILFGIEIIKYFKLEERLPSFAKFFKLRSTFQRYYLMWNMFLLFGLCIVGISVNMLVLFG